MKTIQKWGLRAALLLTVLLQACGGGEAGDGTPASGEIPGSARPQAARGAPEALFAQDGTPSAAARHPAAHDERRTLAGLYATPEQYAWEALTVEPYTVLVDVDAHASADAAVDKTLRDFRWSRDGARAAYYVQARDKRVAVEVADELAASGVPLVFLIVEPRS